MVLVSLKHDSQKAASSCTEFTFTIQVTVISAPETDWSLTRGLDIAVNTHTHAFSWNQTPVVQDHSKVIISSEQRRCPINGST